jgi:hypothetical protein
MPTLVASIRREHVESFIEDLDRRFKPATVGVRFRSLQQLMRWMLEEGEITADPMARMRPPKVPEDPPAVLSDTELRGLLRAAEGDRRDTALLRVFIDTGARLSEVAGLRLADVDLDDGTLGVLGKGERVRVLPIGVKTIKALDRYLRVRRRDDVDALWLGGKGAMTPSGITQMLRRRALQAGIGHVHPHQFRHTIRVRDHLSFGDGATGHGEGLAAFEHGGAQRGGSRRDRFAPPTLESVVVPADPRDGAHLRAALTRLAEQGPLIDVRVSDVDGQASVSLYGQVQKEVIQATLVRDFGIEVAFRRVTQLHVERLARRRHRDRAHARPDEPVQRNDRSADRAGDGRLGHCVPARRRSPLDAAVHLRDRGRVRLEHAWVCSGRAGRGLHGWRVTDCHVTMTDCVYSSSDGPPSMRGPRRAAADFRKLTPMVVARALRAARTIVCEPVLRLRLEVPTDAVPTVVPALAKRGAAIEAPISRGPLSTIEVIVPAARAHELQRDLPGLTGGEGVLESDFAGYRPVTGEPPRRPV